jgi:hypothetical protein
VLERGGRSGEQHDRCHDGGGYTHGPRTLLQEL